MNPEDQLKADWKHERSRYEDAALTLNEDPAKELGSKAYRRVLAGYRQSGKAGRKRLEEAIARVVAARMAEIQRHMKASGHYEKLVASGHYEKLVASELEAFQEALDREADRMVLRDLPFNLAAVREYLDFTFKDVEALSGLSNSTVNNIERGVTNPRLSHVKKLAVALGIHPTLLLMDYDALEAWSETLHALLAPLALTQQGTLGKLRASLHRYELTPTYEEMRQMEQDEHPAGNSPSDWMDALETAAREVAEILPSPGAALGAVIGRNWAGRHGAFVVGYLGHRLQSALRRQLPDSVSYPPLPVVDALKWRLPGRFGSST